MDQEPPKQSKGCIGCLGWVFVVILVLVSRFTASPPEEKLNGLTYATTMAGDREASRASWNKLDVIHSVVIVALILGILFYFSPLWF